VNKMDNNSLLSCIFELPVKPRLYEPGESLFWNDPHISKGMLEAHLNSNIDSASRKHKTIDKEVNHLISSGVLKPGDKILDLGCGPGLYSSRFAIKGIKVTGIDISQNSLDYARHYAAEKGLDIDYHLINFFDIDYSGMFDAVIQVNGELNTFSDEKRDELLAKLRKALRPGGHLIFDVTTRTRELRLRKGITNRWLVSERGFWRPGRHLVLERGFDYPEDSVWLDQYIIIDSTGVKVYNNWFHDYDLDTIREVIQKAGFDVIDTWNDLTGSPYSEGGEWIAIVAKRNN
jgi:SAM-dependent methyltransferase